MTLGDWSGRWKVKLVAVIGLLAALVVPGARRLRIRSKGDRILTDCRSMDHAIDQSALSTGQSNGAPIDTVAAAPYLQGFWPTNDVLGNPFRFSVVGPTQICIHPDTITALRGGDIGWGNYNCGQASPRVAQVF